MHAESRLARRLGDASRFAALANTAQHGTKTQSLEDSLCPDTGQTAMEASSDLHRASAWCPPAGQASWGLQSRRLQGGNLCCP